MSHFGHYLIDRRERGRHTEFSVAGGAIAVGIGEVPVSLPVLEMVGFEVLAAPEPE